MRGGATCNTVITMMHFYLVYKKLLELIEILEILLLDHGENA